MGKLDLLGVLICVVLYTIGVFLLGAAITGGLFIVHVVFVPLLFKYSKAFQRTIVFANFVQWPLNIDFEEPSKRGINGGRNLYLEYTSKVDNCKIKLGIWHIVPNSSYEKLKGFLDSQVDKEHLNKLLDEDLVNSGKPIILYCHGNSNSRGATHRIDLYKFFQNMDYHTIAFDYRGYGDSSNIIPSEDGVVEDTLVVYDWLNNIVAGDGQKDKPSIFIWGHSLGTGISANLFGNLEELSQNILERSTPLPQPKGLLLEAPFNNLAEEVENHPLSKLVQWLPHHERTFVAPFRVARAHRFVSDAHLARVRTLPLLVLHAKDDMVVPFILGVKLYKAVVASRSKSDADVSMHAYDASLGLGHKWICHAPDLANIVGNFINKHR